MEKKLYQDNYERNLCHSEATKHYWDFLFYDEETGEEFFVECETLKEAKRTAKMYFAEPKYIDKYSETEAEILGYDTY